MRRCAVLLAVLVALCSQAYAQQQPFRGAISGFSLRAVYPTGWLGYPYSLTVGGETKFRWNEKGELECGTVTSNGVVLTAGSTSLLNMSDWPSGLTLAELGYLANVTSDIQSQLGGKAAASHSHAQGDVTGLESALSGKASTSHGHALSDVADLVSALAGKSDTGHTHTYLPLSGGALTGAVTTNSTLDGVDVSAHDHSSATGQTRLALKDRAWSLVVEMGTVGSGGSSVAAGNSNGSYGPCIGFTLPSDLHITNVELFGYAPIDHTLNAVIWQVTDTTASEFWTGDLDTSSGAAAVCNRNPPLNTEWDADTYRMAVWVAKTGGTSSWTRVTIVLRGTID